MTNHKKELALKLEKLIREYEDKLNRIEIIGSLETIKLIYTIEKWEEDEEIAEMQRE